MTSSLLSLFRSCEQLRGAATSTFSKSTFALVQLEASCYSTLTNMTQDSKRSGCLFCKICDDTTQEGLDKLLHSDDKTVVFRDIYPAAKHHYLVVSREHVPTPKSLTKDQKPLLEQMIAIAKQTLEKEGADMSDIRLGFHWPPFHSIQHLHLHAISPTNEMSFVKRLMFRENSWWFVSSDYVLNRLDSST